MATYDFENKVLKTKKHKITSPYGMRVIFGQQKMHNGIDIVGENSTLDYVVAFADGTVVVSKFASDTGEYVKIDHGNNNYTRYLHLKSGSRTVKVGDKVLKGQIVGYMGATGKVTGAHLHFDVNVNGKYVDPEPYLKGEKGFNVSKKNVVLEWQKAAIADGFSFPKYGADGAWGEECEAVAKKAVCKKPKIKGLYTNKNLTKFLQKQMGYTGNDIDGKFWTQTEKDLKIHQKKLGFVDDDVDGIAGYNTWKKTLGV